jgi:hypothetical protein
MKLINFIVHFAALDEITAKTTQNFFSSSSGALLAVAREFQRYLTHAEPNRNDLKHSSYFDTKKPNSASFILSSLLTTAGSIPQIVNSTCSQWVG